ncbi:MAG: YIP1 family protein [Candidatus Gracilibacteria bacterium]
MNIVNEVKVAISVLKLDKVKMAEVAKNKEATFLGIGFLAVPAIINVILTALTFPSGFGSIFSRFLLWPIVIPVLSTVATTFLVSLVAEKAFKGNKDHVGFFRIVSYASVVLWVTILAYLLRLIGLELVFLASLVAGLYLLYVIYNILMEHHKLTKEHAIYTIIAAFFISILVSSILGNVLVGSGYRMY